MAGAPKHSARVLTASESSIRLAADALKRGDVVAIPTETVYGLAGVLWDEAALARIFSKKERPKFDPLIAHVSEALLNARSSAGDWTQDPLQALEALPLVRTQGWDPDFRARVNELLRRFWPGPLTLVLPKAPAVPDLATSGFQEVAVRMPAHPLAARIITEAKAPLAAPSANRFGRISPTRAEHVLSELGDRLNLILDGGACEIGVESTILQVHPDFGFRLLRPGGLPQETLEAVLKARLSSADPDAKANAPGSLESHYAPGKPLQLLPHLSRSQNPEETLERWRSLFERHAPSQSIGLIFFDNASSQIFHLSPLSGSLKIQKTLFFSSTGHPEDCARNLFSCLRQIDETSAEFLFAEEPPSHEGLFHALYDRLKKASFLR